MSTRLSKINQPVSIEFGFAEVEMALANVHNVRTDRRGAFVARIKNLIKLGILPGVQAGRGRAVAYSPWHLSIIAVGIELAQLGLSPERAVTVVQANQKTLAAGLYLAAHYHIKAQGGPVVFWFDPAGLSDLMRASPRGDRTASGFLTGPTSQVVAYLEKWLPNGLSRLAIFNASFLIADLASYTVGGDRRGEFFAELRNVIVARLPELEDGDT